MTNSKYLLKEINEFLLIKEKINNFLSIILGDIDFVISKIKSSNDEKEIKLHFDELQEIQNALSILIFSQEIRIGKYLSKFIKDYDRLDDSEIRNFFVKQIKNNEYSLFDN